MLMHTIVKVLKPLSREFSIVLLLPKVHVEGTHGINLIDKKLTTCCEQSALAIVSYSLSSTRLKSKNCQLRSELLWPVAERISRFSAWRHTSLRPQYFNLPLYLLQTPRIAFIRHRIPPRRIGCARPTPSGGFVHPRRAARSAWVATAPRHHDVLLLFLFKYLCIRIIISAWLHGRFSSWPRQSFLTRSKHEHPRNGGEPPRPPRRHQIDVSLRERDVRGVQSVGDSADDWQGRETSGEHRCRLVLCVRGRFRPVVSFYC